MTEMRNTTAILNTLQMELDKTPGYDVTPGMVYVDRSVARNKERMQVTAATVPKKGMIRLAVDGATNSFTLPQG